MLGSLGAQETEGACDWLGDCVHVRVGLLPCPAWVRKGLRYSHSGRTRGEAGEGKENLILTLPCPG